MNYSQLTDEEEKLLKSYDKGELISVADSAQKKLYQKIAANSLKKMKNINIRLSEKVLVKLKARAIEEGLPYQTLVSSVLYRYVQKTL